MSNCFLLLWLLLILISLQMSGLICKKMNKHHSHVPAMYVFGDSLVDCGNNNHLHTPSKANFLPYGIDFNATPTGRATNGKTVADYIALFLGLPLVPPYLGLSEIERRNVTNGINYASAGCGILPETERKGMCLSLDTQTELFQRTVEKDLPKHLKRQSKLENHLSMSLFFVSIGVNDFSLVYLPNTKRKFPSPDTFAQFLLNEFSFRLQRLYSLGARKFLVNNLPPAGCLPAEVIKLKSQTDCNEERNNMLSSYNIRLPSMLHHLQSQLPGAVFIHSDYFNFLLNLISNSKNYGITERRKPCCPDKIEEGDIQCHPRSVPCRNRDKYLFFDEYHPSQIANSIYANQCFTELTFCTPLNLLYP